MQLFLGNLFYLAVPLLFKQAVQIFNEGLSPDKSLIQLLLWSLLLLMLTLFSAIFKYFSRKSFLVLSLSEERRVKQRLFEKIQTFSEKFYDQYSVGELMNLMTQDMQLFRDMLRIGIYAPLNLLTLVIPTLLTLAWISGTLTMLAIIPLFFVPFIMWNVMRWIYRLTVSRQEALGEISRFTHESFTGIRLVKAYGNETGFVSHLKKLAQKLYSASLRLNTLESSFFPVVVTVTRLVTIALVVTSAFIIAFDLQLFDTSSFLSFMWLQSYLLFPILIFGWALPLIQKGKASYDRLVKVYEWRDPIQNGGESDLKILRAPQISLNNLSFSYTPGEEVLKKLNATFTGGEMIGITGPLASGKSTLLKLLLRSYETEKGAIKIENIPLQDYPLETLQESIGFVDQTPFFLSDSVLENIKLANRQASVEEIEHALFEAELFETIQAFPSQHQTEIGERGITLSGGQKKRLALARVMMTKRPIILLDDIFSALDSETANRLFKRLKSRLKGHTVIIVDHRASLLAELDWVLYLVKGEILEQGTPKELLKRKEGALSTLTRLQEALS